jgi:pimeloyl-ACP methyl ester carboxylesterase
VDTRLVGGVSVREWGSPAAPGILLWPGIGSAGSYFAAVAEALPGRAVAVDPPGSGGSPPLSRVTFEGLVDAALAVIEDRACRAIVGHSLGAYVAAGVATRPPPSLSAAVLIDGGFLDADARGELGMPLGAGRDALIAWLRENSPHFPDWGTAIAELAEMVGTRPTPAFEAYVRDVFGEADGEIRETTPVDATADLLLAGFHGDPLDRARRLQVPTLLIACGRPPESRPIKEPAWTAFANASPLVELHVAEQWTHNPILQDPDTAGQLIADWLARHL